MFHSEFLDPLSSFSVGYKSECNAHSTEAPINLPVNKNKDYEFYGIVTILPKFSIMTSYLGIVISVCWRFCAN